MVAPGAVQIAMIFWLAPTHGALGAAMAAATGAGAGALLLALIGRRLFAPPLPWPALARIAAACGVMTAAVTASPHATGALGLAASVGIGVLAYAAAAFSLNLFDAHARMSAVSQALAVKLGGFIHISFTDRPHARARR
jgi:O-antigen/teichoic acid export membrane protein